MSSGSLITIHDPDHNSTVEDTEEWKLGSSMLPDSYVIHYDQKQYKRLDVKQGRDTSVASPALHGRLDSDEDGADADDENEDEASSWGSDERHEADKRYEAESFKLLHEGVIDRSKSIQEKCEWLRSQLIGRGVEFDTPFGRRLLTYADHTASGQCLQHIENYIIENVLPYYGNTHTDDSFVGHGTTKMVHEAAQYIKSCIGGGSEDVLLFCGWGTTAAIKRLQEVMGIVVPSNMRSRVVRDLQPEERWVVFVGPYEHHSNLLSWRQSLAEVVEIGVDAEGLVDMAGLRRELESPKYAHRPMLGSFSACSNVTGLYTDSRALARLLHEHGAFACFDFAANGPYVKIDMRSGELEGYDAVFLSPHKFVGGPGTPGILLMSKTLYCLGSAPPSSCGGGTVAYVNGFDEKDTLYYEDIEEREDAGTPAIVQKIRAALAFWVKEYMGYHLIHTQEGLWTERALKRLLLNPNISVLGNTKAKRQPIVSFLVYANRLDDDEPNNGDAGDGRGLNMWRERATARDKPLHGCFVTKLLNDLFGIQARGGCACAGPYGHILLNVDKQQSIAFRSAVQKGYKGLKPGWTRISFSYYISDEEFEFILAAIEFIALHGQRFLPLYHFNWKSGDWTFKKSAAGVIADKLDGTGHHPLTTTRNFTSESIDRETIAASHVENIYASYLENAKIVGESLPKFPNGRRVPTDVDADLILFKI